MDLLTPSSPGVFQPRSQQMENTVNWYQVAGLENGSAWVVLSEYHQNLSSLSCDYTLQDDFCAHEPGLTDDMQRILQELTSLHKAENAKVALRARQVGTYHVAV